MHDISTLFLSLDLTFSPGAIVGIVLGGTFALLVFITIPLLYIAKERKWAIARPFFAKTIKKHPNRWIIDRNT